jgi:hypothetical protein
MKRLLVLCVTALIGISIYAATAGGGQQAGVPLKQFAALKKQVNKLKSDLNTLGAFTVGCVAGNAIPVTRYEGYVYQDTAGTNHLTTALDVTETGGTPNGYALLVNADPTCLNLINSTLSLRKLSTQGFRLAPAHDITRATHR